MERPLFIDIKTSVEFKRWYWLKDELVTICKAAKLPYDGGKFTLRDRIIYALDNGGAIMPTEKKAKPQSRFNWANANLTLETVITDSVSFGPNFRRFLTQHIGNQFVCHSDFMDWVKINAGKTLQDAVLAWQDLEDRKNDPNFKRTIAEHNMLAQYVRDFLDDNVDKKLKDALKMWQIKKQMPTETGFVRYEKTDLENFIHP
jgi:Domain of unknown function (DUF6434)/SAP domain-containing new25